MFAIFGMAYPFILLINIFFALFWLVQMRLYAFFSIGAIVLGIPFFNDSFQFKAFESKEQSELKICSYNVGLFGYFQQKWHVPEMVEKVKDIQPDILCVQEFLNLGKSGNSTVDSIKKACGFKYVYFQKLNDGRKKGEYGMALFSNFPIKQTELVHFDGLTGNMCVCVDVLINSSVYSFYNVHLQSFKFNKQDYKFIKEMPEDNDEKLQRSKGMLNRMKNAFIKRSMQVESIKSHMRARENPCFIVGDFNDPPVSYSYHELSQGLKDAFLENGSGMGKTYIGMMPNFRIDYILYPKTFEGLYYKTYRLSSDHSLLSTGLKIAKE